jgi:protein-tyrosine phosphatase
MIDLHCHVLHGIDDGASNLRDAVSLCSIAENENITSIVCTPHFSDYQSIEDFTDERLERFEQLCEAVSYEKISLDIKLGCELYLDDEIFGAPSLDAVTLNGSRYMLCEFSLRHFDYEDALGWIDELKKRGYTPILAHPERYSVFQRTPEILNDFVARDILFQINADSLAGMGGRSAFSLACELVSHNIVDFIASDAHSPRSRPNDLLSKSEYFPDILDNETLETLLETNPERVLKDLTVHPRPRGII